MRNAQPFVTALQSAPTRELRTTLVRRVPLTPLVESGAIDFLFTSGRPYRFNPAGVQCVYFAESEATAAAEYERHIVACYQPFVTYYAEVALRCVLDLCSNVTLKALGLTQRDLRAAWIRARRATVGQLLGEAVSRQSSVSAIRFPSEAARSAGFAGTNVVIFRGCVRRPDFVRILGPGKKPLQRWP
jgi:RES domain-containing protein